MSDEQQEPDNIVEYLDQEERLFKHKLDNYLKSVEFFDEVEKLISTKDTTFWNLTVSEDLKWQMNITAIPTLIESSLMLHDSKYSSEEIQDYILRCVNQLISQPIPIFNSKKFSGIITQELIKHVGINILARIDTIIIKTEQ